jgi:hypothetical protein
LTKVNACGNPAHAQVVQQTNALALVTVGERRYGFVLFEICQTVIRTGQQGRPRRTLPEGVQRRPASPDGALSVENQYLCKKTND